MVNNHFLNYDSKGYLPKEVLRGSEETLLVQFYDITHARAFLESNRFISRRKKKREVGILGEMVNISFLSLFF
ncbi:MAG: hypothetical protein ACXABU_12480 [Candidatus Hodarchaeales archaeon]|jgi:hypothetical protein